MFTNLFAPLLRWFLPTPRRNSAAPLPRSAAPRPSGLGEFQKRLETAPNPRPLTSPLRKPEPDPPQPAKGARRIAFEFIPRAQNYRNARSVLAFLNSSDRFPFSAWSKIRDQVEQEARGCCIVCKGKGTQRKATECHEVWEYDQHTGIQRLKALQALCPDCHAIKHINRHFRADSLPEFVRLLSRYAQLNGISEDEARADFCKAMERKLALDDAEMKLGLSLLAGFRMRVSVPAQFDCHTPAFNKHLQGWKDAG